MVMTQRLSFSIPRLAWFDDHGVGVVLRDWQREVSRRGGLAFQARPSEARGPAWPRLLSELKTPYEMWRAGRAERRDPVVLPPLGVSRPVMLLPGFGTHPVRMKGLRRGLEGAGHRVSDWGLGFNFGPSADRFDRLC